MSIIKISNLRTILLTSGLALMLGGIASAASISQNMGVSADISNTCSFGTVNNLAFGAYDPVVTNLTTDLTNAATFALTCTSGDVITIGLSLGANAVGSQRYAIGSGAGNKISYNLFQDSAHTTAWDETTTLASTGAGTATTYTVYGVVPHGQIQPADTYADTVSIDVTY